MKKLSKHKSNWLKGLALVAVLLCTSIAMTACSFGFGSKSQSYTITYYANDGTEKYRTETCYDYQKDAFTIGAGISFDRSWYRFVEWNTAADGTGTAYESHAKYQITGDLKLYAIWEDATRQITYHANNGTEEIVTQTFDSNRSVNLNASDTFTLDGYEIAHWNTSANDTGTGYYPSSYYKLTDNLDLYAIWRLKNYSVSYMYYTDSGSYLSGVTNAGNPSTYTINTPTFSLQAPSKDGYSFEGWYREREFINPVTEITQGTTGDIRLYGKFVLMPNTYSITYVMNGGVNGDNPLTYTTQTDTFTLQEPTKAGYPFAGWYSDSNFTNQVTEITKGTKGNITLYAKWYSAAEIYNVDNGTITGLTEIGKSLTVLDIPSQINGVTITAIGERAFEKQGIKAITIPVTLTSIGDYAFYSTSSSYRGTKVYISDLSAWCQIEFGYLGNPLYNSGELYINDEKVTDLVIPDGVTRIGNYAFYGCDTLTSVTIPNSVTSVGREAFGVFYGSCSLSKVYVTDLSAWVQIDFGDAYANPLYRAGKGTAELYVGNERMTEIVIPDGTTHIGSYSFSGYTGTSVTIPSSITSIGNRAFNNSPKLVRINIVDLSAWCQIDFTLQSNISQPLYFNGELLTDLVIPDGVTTIKQFAFFGCDTLTTVTFPDSITTIEYAAFGVDENLRKVNISNLSVWYQIDFESAQANPLNNGATLYVNGKQVTDIIPDGVTTIKKYAFYGYNGLSSVVIPNSVTSIGDCAFEKCYSLAEIYNLSNLTITAGSIDNGYIGYYAKVIHTTYDDVSNLVTADNGVVYYVDGDDYIAVKYVGLATKITLDEKTTAINEYAFRDCSNLTSVVIPNSVVSIGYSAFMGCSSLQSITIPFVGGSTDATNGASLFGYIFGGENGYDGVYTEQSYNTTGAGQVIYYIPRTLTTVTITGGDIPYGAFSNCSGLRRVTILDNVTSIGKYAFNGCSYLFEVYNLSDLTITAGSTDNGYIGYYAKVIHTSLDEASNLLTAENGVIYYVDENDYIAVKYVGSATEITLDTRTTAIIPYAFYLCSELTSVVIPNKVTSIGTLAFLGCSNLTSVTFDEPDGWYVWMTPSATSGINLTLTDTTKNVTYLIDTYKNYYWFKK